MTPFRQAWIVLKQTRQTTLGEYHPDFPSPHGDVQYYHGTTVAPASRIRFEGLKPSEPFSPMWRKIQREKWPEAQNRQKGIYATSDLNFADTYAGMRGQDRNQQGRVFGIRAGVPETPTSVDMLSAVRFNSEIPRQYLAPYTPDDVERQLTEEEEQYQREMSE